MNHVLVTGGTGNLGKWVIDYLLKKNCTVSVLSSKSDIQLFAACPIVKGDLTTDSGLAEAIAQADTIIHCASNPRNFAQVDINGTRNLLTSLNRNKTRHIVYISIVGIDKSSYPYYQAKYTAEKMIADSGIPFTILRTTQFHGFVLNMVQSFVVEQMTAVVKIPAGMKFQSVDIREVAKQLVNTIEKPSGLLPDFGGSEILLFEDMIQQYLTHTKIKTIIQPMAIEGERYDLFRSGINLSPGNNYGKITWQQFLEAGFGNE